MTRMRFIREETTAFRRWKRSGSDRMETTGVSRWSFIGEEAGGQVGMVPIN